LSIVTLENPKLKKATNEESKLNGKTFVITGTLSKPREDFKEIIENLGGKVSGSVSSKTDYLLLGESENGKVSTKEATAKKLGVQIISEAEFRKLVAKKSKTESNMIY